MDDRDLTALRAEAIAKAIEEAECNRDFLRQCVTWWIDGYSAEELSEFVNPPDELE